MNGRIEIHTTDFYGTILTNMNFDSDMNYSLKEKVIQN